MRETNLSDETRVPLKWVLALLAGATGSLGGFVAIGVWAGGVESRANTTEATVTKLEEKVEVIHQIDKRLSRIEGALGLPPKKFEDPSSEK